MKAITQGWYKTTVGASTLTQCEVNKQCTTTASTACDAMKYSPLGYENCFRLPIGKTTHATSATTDCTTAGYNKKTSACDTCTYKKCDKYTAITQTCPVGYYFSSASSMASQACTICPAGKYCKDGATAPAAVSAFYPVRNTQAPDNKMHCAAGYSCTTSSMTRLTAGYYNTAE